MQLVWHRADLRTHDNSALSSAAQQGPVLGIVVFDPHILQATSSRRVAWFMHNVQALREAYQSLGSQLVVRTGKPWEVLPQLCAELGASAIHATENFTPYALERDRLVTQALKVPLHLYGGQYIQSPNTVLKPDGKPYTVFTPYYKTWQKQPLHTATTLERLLMPALPAHFDAGTISPPDSDVVLPVAGEQAALAQLEYFINHKLEHYSQERNTLHGHGGSGVSAYISLGVLSPRLAAQRGLSQGAVAQTWIAELAWRDFSGALLYHFPHMQDSALDPKWNALPSNPDPQLLHAWQQARTGIPLVDACMNQLRQTGQLSNRGRMCVAQFAVKLALLPWKSCEQTMKHLLLDGDTASNLQGWQWSGGLGVDAAPYFRVFSMESQAKTHDPDGSYLRTWGTNVFAPELPWANLATARAHYLEIAQRIVKG